MNIKNLENLSISNLILIILNDKNRDNLRKYAEVELRKRIKNVGWQFDDLLHLDDKVIQKRGLDINNYLISRDVNIKQLMETYFMYVQDKDNSLLFSEKHLCNNKDYGDLFFTKVCTKEIENLNKRLECLTNESQKELLLSVKQILEKRNQEFESYKPKLTKDGPEALPCFNDAMWQIEGIVRPYREFLPNWSDEEKYKLLTSKLKSLKIRALENFNYFLYESDFLQYLYISNFVRKDSSRLSYQKSNILKQLKNHYEVNYDTEEVQKVLKKINK